MITYGNWNDEKWDVLRAGIDKYVFTGEGATCQLTTGEKLQAVKPHSHSYEQIAIILEGECFFVVNGEKFPMKAGSFIVVPPNMEHYLDGRGFEKKIVNLDIFVPKREDILK